MSARIALDVAVLVAFVAASAAVLLAAPAGPPIAVVAYVLLVELPTVFVLAFGASAYIEWHARR